jgi:hypothetical protein
MRAFPGHSKWSTDGGAWTARDRKINTINQLDGSGFGQWAAGFDDQ